MATYNQSQMTLPSGDVVKFIDNTSGYTKNTGTITGVTANGGLTGGGTSGAVTISHSNSVTAQTTQAVYPIKIDAQGHISAYGSAVTIPSAVTESTVSGWGFTKNAGTVTSVRVQATSPVASSVSTAQTGSLNTTISLNNGYGDTKNPYAAKSANQVLAGPSSGEDAVPEFRTLVAADIPTLTKSKISDFPTSMTPTSHTHGNLSNDGKITSTATIATGDKLVVVDSDTTAASKITGSSITFDTSKTGMALTQAGTWAAFTNNAGTITGITTSSPLSGSGTSGSVAISHANSGATAGSYGDESAQTPSHGGIFKVPYVTVNATGHVTGISEHTVTLPADSNTNYYHAISTTAAGTAAKTATATSYVLNDHNRFTLYISTTNTAKSALTLNVNGTGAKTVYINGTASSTSNYTWPAGAYQVYYDGTYYHIRTDGKIPGYNPSTTSIGSASAGTAIAADDITSWTTNTPTSVTKKTVVTSATFNDVVTGGTTTSIPNVTSAGSTPTLQYTARSVGSASGWSKGTAASAAYSDGVLTITNGTTPSLTITSVACDDITSWDAGSAPSLGTAIKAYTSLTTGASGSATTGDSVSVTAGTAATLNYTARSIPNISVSSKTVVTGLS